MLQKSKFNMLIIVERVFLCPNYYSDWSIKVSGSKNFETTIRSWPEETEVSLWNKINALSNISLISVNSLNKKNKINYD